MKPLEPELRRLIADSMPAAAPGPDVAARGLERLLAALPGPGGQGGEPGAGDPGPAVVGGPTSALVSGLRALLLVGGITGAAVGVAAITRDDPAPAAREQSAPRESAARGEPVARGEDVAPREPLTPEEPGTQHEPVTQREPVAPSVRAPGERASVRPHADTPPAIDPLLAETLAVAEADAALGRGEHARARELARAIARTYPEGQLALERAAIELGARCGLQEPDAAAAAGEFLRLHGDTAVATKVRTRCGEPKNKSSPG